MSRVDVSDLDQLLFEVLEEFSSTATRARHIASAVSAFEAMLDLDVESLTRQDRRQWRRRSEEVFSDESMETLQGSREFVQEHIMELSALVARLREFLEALDADAMDVDPMLLTLRKF